jgi:UDP-galactopyranose mutase
MRYKIIIESGLYEATTAWKANKLGLRVLVLEKRPFIDGNIHDKIIEGINVHLYTPIYFIQNTRQSGILQKNSFISTSFDIIL